MFHVTANLMFLLSNKASSPYILYQVSVIMADMLYLPASTGLVKQSATITYMDLIWNLSIMAMIIIDGAVCKHVCIT